MLDKYLSQIRKINEKIDLKTEFPDWKKSVQFNVTDVDNGAFYFVADGQKISKIGEGKLDSADVTIEGTDKAMAAMFGGDISIVGAFITKDLTIQGTIGDALGAKVLLEAVRVY